MDKEIPACAGMTIRGRVMENQQKELLRKHLRRELKNLPEEDKLKKSQIITEKLITELQKHEALKIAIYKAIPGEVDISGIARLTNNFCMPVLEKENSRMSFREYSFGDRLEPDGIYGKIMQPLAGKSEIIPGIIIVPLLGFDATGARLGRGGGYYDRTLAFLRQQKKIIAIAVAFELQKVDLLPSDKYDEKMDMIITERQIYNA